LAAGGWEGYVEVSAPSHVHAGNPDIHGGLGRLFGTLGLALREPRLRVRVWRSPGEPAARGPESGAALEFARLYSRLAGCSLGVEVLEAIPRGVGLGGTTPLALSIAVAAFSLCGWRASLEEAALAAGRARVSGLGFHTFRVGGLIFDGGFRPGRRRVPPLVFRADVPDSVAVVVALPEGLVERVKRFKEREEELLREPPRMDEWMAERASRIVLMGVLANAAAGEWREALHWLARFNRELGEYWARWQGGAYCCGEVEAIIDGLEAAGAWGAGQSSWGPTVYAFTGAREAAGLAREAERLLERHAGGGRVWVTRASNVGARVRLEG